MTLPEIKFLLQRHGLWAKKSLGQNFLVDEKALDRIVEAAELSPSDQVIEVGPGTGILTERLIKQAGQVTAVELDQRMIDILKERFGHTGKFQIIHDDILKIGHWSLGIGHFSYKLVANIPYYITSPLIKHFLQSDCRPRLMVLLVQKEVAEKICGLSGKSLITIETQLFGEPEIVGIVPAHSFYPAPKVDSAILKIRVFEKPLVPAEQLKSFLHLVKSGFSQKRKKLSNTLSAGLRCSSAEMKGWLLEAGIDPDLRAEHLGIGEWKKLAKVLTKNKKLLS